MRECEFETSVSFVRFKLRFAQSRRLTIAALDRHEHLPSVTGGASRLQFCSLARLSVRLVEFSFGQENAGEIASRYNSKWIEFDRLAGKLLGLSNLTNIHQYARK